MVSAGGLASGPRRGRLAWRAADWRWYAGRLVAVRWNVDRRAGVALAARDHAGGMVAGLWSDRLAGLWRMVPARARTGRARGADDRSLPGLSWRRTMGGPGAPLPGCSMGARLVAIRCRAGTRRGAVASGPATNGDGRARACLEAARRDGFIVQCNRHLVRPSSKAAGGWSRPQGGPIAGRAHAARSPLGRTDHAGRARMVAGRTCRLWPDRCRAGWSAAIGHGGPSCRRADRLRPETWA